MRHASLGGDFGDRLNDVGAVFLRSVVAAGGRGAFLTVVTDGQAATEVEDTHAGAFLHEADIHARCFIHRLADGADVRDLRALVIMQHAQAVEHAFFTQVIHDTHELGNIEAKDARITAAAAPMPGAFGAKAETYAERGSQAHFFAALEDEIELRRHFEHEDDLQAHFLRVEGEIDELLILVAIAHDVGLRVVHVGQRGDQFRLAAGFETVVIFAAVTGDLLDDFLLLIDLDGIHAAIDALIFAFPDRRREAFIQFVDASAQQIAEAHEHRELRAAFAQAFDDRCERDGLRLLAVLQIYHDLTRLRDVEVFMSPFADAIQLGAVFCGPLRCFHCGLRGVGFQGPRLCGQIGK